MLRFFLFAISSAFVTGYTLFEPRDVISTEYVEVLTNLRSKRDLRTHGMPRSLDISLSINGKYVTVRLEKDEGHGPTSRTSILWAPYACRGMRGVRGIFIVRQPQEKSTALEIEGYMMANSSLHLIQPMASGSHMIHRLRDSLGFSENVMVEPKREERLVVRKRFTLDNMSTTGASESLVQTIRGHSARVKRDVSLLRRKLLMFKLAVNYDMKALDLIKRKLSLAPVIDVNSMLQQFGAIIGMYISECFLSLLPNLNIKCRSVTLQAVQKINPPGDTPEVSVDGERPTYCGITMMNELWRFNFNWQHHDHAIFLTGYDLVNGKGGVSMNGAFSQNSVCTVRSVSLVEFSFDLTMLRHAARSVTPSLGAELDFQLDPQFLLSKPRSIADTYIMSPYLTPTYDAARLGTLFEYSPKTKDSVTAFLRNLPAERANRCLLDVPYVIPKLDIGNRFDLNAQCRLAVKKNAHPVQNLVTICSHGIACGDTGSIERILPFPGTPCGPAKEGKCRWIMCVRY